MISGPCNRIVYAGYGFKFPCANLRPCPQHDRKRPASKVSEAPLPPTKKTTPVPPALSLFEAV